MGTLYVQSIFELLEFVQMLFPTDYIFYVQKIPVFTINVHLLHVSHSKIFICLSLAPTFTSWAEDF